MPGIPGLISLWWISQLTGVSQRRPVITAMSITHDKNYQPTATLAVLNAQLRANQKYWSEIDTCPACRISIDWKIFQDQAHPV